MNQNDDLYSNAFKEIDFILNNTDTDLLKKIPNSFRIFIKQNMNNNYSSSIANNIDLEKQQLLPKTRTLIALIYRDFLASDIEKDFFKKQHLDYILPKKQNIKDIDSIFLKNKHLNDSTSNNINQSLTIVKKQSFFRIILNKLHSFFKKAKKKS